MDLSLARLAFGDNHDSFFYFYVPKLISSQKVTREYFFLDIIQIRNHTVCYNYVHVFLE